MVNSLTLVLFMIFEFVTQSKSKQVGLHQTSKLLPTKETVNKMNRQPAEGKKTLVNHILDNGLKRKTYF